MATPVHVTDAGPVRQSARPLPAILLIAMIVAFAVPTAGHARVDPVGNLGIVTEPTAPAQWVEIAMIRPPVAMRGCVSDANGGLCRHAIAGDRLTNNYLGARIAPILHEQRLAMIALLVLALAMALTLVVMFWRHLAVSVVTGSAGPEPRRVQISTRRRRGMSL